MKVSVIGSGAWGTALSKVLQDKGHDVTMWGRDATHLERMRTQGLNDRYLAAAPLGPLWRLTPKLDQAVQGAQALVMAVPSHAFREVCQAIGSFSGWVISATKGVEHGSELTMTGILSETISGARPVALSGPTLAEEVLKGMPTAMVAAADQSHDASAVQEMFHLPHFRVYTSRDRLGVEYGGALKNVIALAAGVCAGLGLGYNSNAALVTRGMAEMRRIGIYFGGHVDTFSGLSGLGDLMVTCFSSLSRNRSFGERLGAGADLEALLRESVSVVEGYHAVRSVAAIIDKGKLEAPIHQEVYAMLYQGKPAHQAMADLLSREARKEDD